MYKVSFDHIKYTHMVWVIGIINQLRVPKYFMSTKKKK